MASVVDDVIPIERARRLGNQPLVRDHRNPLRRQADDLIVRRMLSCECGMRDQGSVRYVITRRWDFMVLGVGSARAGSITSSGNVASIPALLTRTG